MMDRTPNVSVCNVGAVDASATPVINVFKAPNACKVTVHKIYLVNGSAIAAHATNIHTSTIKRLRAAAATTIATQTTDSDVSGSAAIAADTPWEIPLSSDALGELNADDVLQWFPTEGGTATSGDLTEAAIFVEWSAGTGAGQ